MKYSVKVLVDFGKSFTDTNGSFYCGTTDEQKNNAVKVVRGGDLILYLVDVHTRGSSEFIVNGGPYPTHNLVSKDQYDLASLGVEEGKTTDPQLTQKLYDLVKDQKSGLIVPRHVFFQDYDGGAVPSPDFSFEDVEKTFDVKKLNSKAFLDEGIKYIVNAKHMFDGAGVQSTEWMGHVPGVPDMEMSAFTLLKEKYGQGKDLQFDLAGVVMGICVYQTATGIRQMFPKAEINVIADSCTHLVYEPLGIKDEDMGNLVAKAMCKQVGINYLSTQEFLGK